MKRVPRPFQQTQPVQAEATRLFVLIVLSALSLATIIVTETFKMLGLEMSAEVFQLLLVATGCVAFPMAGLAAQYDFNARTLEEVVPADPVTGLASPKFLELAVTREVAAMTKASPPGAVALFEIDHMKQLRDHFGVAYADEVVRWVSETVVASLHAPYDRLARTGDGTFIIVFKEMALVDAEHYCERLLRELKLAAANIDVNGSRLTLSFGLAPITAGVSFHASLEEADIALNDAVRFGRNQVRSRHCMVTFGI